MSSRLLRRTPLVRVGAAVLAAVLTAAVLSTVAPSGAIGAGAAPDGGTVTRSEATGTVGFIGSGIDRPIDSGFSAADPAAEVAASFAMSRARDLGLTAGGTDLRTTEQHATAGGGTAVRLSQTVHGIPVLGGEFVVNLDEANNVLSVLGEASPVGAVPTTPSVAASAAASRALAAVAKSEKAAPRSFVASEPALRFYDPRLLGAPGPFQSARLSWVVEVTGQQQGVTTVDQTVVVDATRGFVALAFSNIADAKNRIVCDSDETEDEYPCTLGLAEWTETSQPAGVDPDVELAFRYAGDSYDFYAARFGRDSLDGSGLQLRSTTDYCIEDDPGTPGNQGECPYENAFWDGEQMVYGDGFASADDVVGHELTHGVTDFTSGLYYYQQSGAINESMSDIFGELIDLTNTGGTDTAAVRWAMGEDVPGFGAIRNMKDPTVFGDPDRMLSPLYFSDPSEQDGGGVHSNSGVGNKAAYLMTDGGTFNGQAITGLGIEKTAQLYYTVNTSMLVSGSDYADLANGLRQACANLATAKVKGITAADCAQVEKVLLATEMDQNPANSPTSTAKVCPGGGGPVNAYFDNLESPAGQFTTETLVPAEPASWYYPQNPNKYGTDSTYATSGSTNIWGDDDEVVTDSAIRMTSPVVVPASGYLSFAHAYGFDDDDTTSFGYDGGVVEYSSTGAGGPWKDAGGLFTGSDSAGYNGIIHSGFGNPLGGRQGFIRESNGYGASRADLASLAGQSVMFRWRIGTDNSVPDAGWFIDDVRVYSCDSTAPQTTITSGPKNKSHIKKRQPRFAFASSEPGSTFRCSVDGAGFAACATPYTTARLKDGKHSFAVAAVDTHGNVDATPATRTFTVDKKPPKTRIKSHPSSVTSSHRAAFRFDSNEKKVEYRCSLDGKKYKKCKTEPTFTVSSGSHTVKVRAVDRAGNKDQSAAAFTWRVRR